MNISYEQLKMVVGVCRSSRERLLEYVARDDLFAESFRRYFKDDRPFVIYQSEPAQVVALKKVINLFERIETIFKRFDTANSILQKTTSIGSVPDLLDAIYELIQVINHSSLLWQDMFGLQLSYIIPIVLPLKQTLSEALAEWSQPELATTIANVVSLVPEQVQEGASVSQINQLIFMLPSYFESLQSMIFREEQSSTRNDPAYLEQIQKKTQKTQDYLNQLLTSDPTSLPINLSVFTIFAQHTYELLDSGMPLTQALHQEAVDRLNQLRHELIPTLISELERLEDKMNLKPMTLVGPTLVQMEKYYHLLAEHIGHVPRAMEQLQSIPRPPILVAAPKLSPKTASSDATSLQTMQDPLFIQKIQENRAERFHQACVERDVLKPKVDVACSFFDRLNDIKNNLRDFSTEKERLLLDYVQFKSHVQAMAPHIDQLITRLLDPESPNESSNGAIRIFFTYLLGSEAFQTILNSAELIKSTLFWESDPLQTILDNEEFIKSALEQELAQKRFDVELIKESSTQRIHAVPLTAPNILPHTTPPVPEKKLLFMHIRDLALSEQVGSLKEELQVFFKENLEFEVFNQLSFVPNSRLPTVEYETGSIVMYQSIVNSLHFLQKGLSYLEGVHDLGNPTDSIPRIRYLCNMALIADCFLKVQSNLGKAFQYPGVQVMLNHGLGRILESIQPIPGITDSLKINDLLLNEEAEVSAQVVDLGGLDDQLSKEKSIALREHIKLFNKNLSLLSTSPLQAIPEAIRLLQLVSGDLDALQKKGSVFVRPFIATLSQTLLSTMDDAEFHLGLKPGVLSKNLEQHIDLFYQTLSFPTERERLQSRISVIDKRIAHENSRECVPELVKERWTRRIDSLHEQKKALLIDFKKTILMDQFPKRFGRDPFSEIMIKEVSEKFPVDELMSYSADEIALKIMGEVNASRLTELIKKYYVANAYLQRRIEAYKKTVENDTSNLVVKEALSWWIKEQDELMKTTHLDISIIENKQNELEERFDDYITMNKANYFIKQIENCLREQPESNFRSDKLRLVAKLKEKFALSYNPTLSPRERLIALRAEMTVENKEILRRDGSPTLVKWIKSLWSFMTGWQPLEVKRMSELKGMLDTIKTDANSSAQSRAAGP